MIRKRAPRPGDIWLHCYTESKDNSDVFTRDIYVVVLAQIQHEWVGRLFEVFNLSTHCVERWELDHNYWYMHLVSEVTCLDRRSFSAKISV